MQSSPPSPLNALPFAALLLGGCANLGATSAPPKVKAAFQPVGVLSDARPSPARSNQPSKFEEDTQEHSAPRNQMLSNDYPDPFGTNLSQHWNDPWPHRHFSRLGTPFVHLFSLEPAFLDRDLFLDYRVTRGPDENEAEFEAELEWALTRRVGVVVEAPILRLDPIGEETESGLGDIALAPRALLVESDTFLLSGNLEFSIPTGDTNRGLGEGVTVA